MQNLKFVLALTPTPDASQWRIGGVGPSGIGAGAGHVHFIICVWISCVFGGQHKPSIQWNMDLKPIFHQKLRARWLPNADKNESNNMKLTCPTRTTSDSAQHKLYSTYLHWESRWVHRGLQWVHRGLQWVHRGLQWVHRGLQWVHRSLQWVRWGLQWVHRGLQWVRWGLQWVQKAFWIPTCWWVTLQKCPPPPKEM